MSCGHDPAIIGNAPVKKAKKVRNSGDQAIGLGRFILGCVFSAGGVFFATGLWYIVALMGFEWGVIAWLVGLLSGLGMKYGYGQQNMLGAIAATAMAAIGILSVKGLIYASFFFVSAVLDVVDGPALEVSRRAGLRCDYPDDLKGYSPYSEKRDMECTEETFKYFDMEEEELAEARVEIDQWYETDRWADPEYAKTRLIYLYAGDFPIFGDESDWQKSYDAALKRTEALPEDQWEATAKKIEKEMEVETDLFEGDEELEKGVDELKGKYGKDSSFFSTMFGPLDALFILLALGTAIKVAGGYES
ncbi:MAG: hypothetical protein DHS20C16_37750 [Phycisphaerae bacterium]|nr:MAG: hypothetical protein DHS20C16_37750 [Phycisphaerae bacterium]